MNLNQPTTKKAPTRISPQVIAVYRTIVDAHRNGPRDGWVTNGEIETALVGHRPSVAKATIRRITLRLTRIGIVEVQGGLIQSNMYRLNDGPLDKFAAGYRDRLHRAAGILGQPIDTTPPASATTSRSADTP